MFCGSCGKENMDGTSFCTGCGKELQEVKRNNQRRVAEKNKKKGKSIISVLIILGVLVLVILLCVLLGNKDSDSKDSGKSKSKVEKEADKDLDTNMGNEYDEEDEENGGFSVLEQIVTPTCKDGVVNKQGNSANNLAYQSAILRGQFSAVSGRVTGQGESVYYYQKGKICRMDGNGNKSEICSVVYASCLNVIGDTLFYLQSEDIYAVDIMGGEPNKLISDVVGNFLVCENSIYYISRESASGTTYNYYVNEYSLNKNAVVKRIEAGNISPTLVSVNPDNDEILYFYQQEDPKYSNYVVNFQPFDMVVSNFDGKREVYTYDDTESGDTGLLEMEGYMLIDDGAWYFIQTPPLKTRSTIHKLSKETYEVEECTELELCMIKNCYDNEFIIETVTKNSSNLRRIALDGIDVNDEEASILMEDIIIEEQALILEVYVVGEYIYYTLDEYDKASLYRVKMDGTGWEELK